MSTFPLLSWQDEGLPAVCVHPSVLVSMIPPAATNDRLQCALKTKLKNSETRYHISLNNDPNNLPLISPNNMILCDVNIA